MASSSSWYPVLLSLVPVPVVWFFLCLFSLFFCVVFSLSWVSLDSVIFFVAGSAQLKRANEPLHRRHTTNPLPRKKRTPAALTASYQGRTPDAKHSDFTDDIPRELQVWTAARPSTSPRTARWLPSLRVAAPSLVLLSSTPHHRFVLGAACPRSPTAAAQPLSQTT